MNDFLRSNNGDLDISNGDLVLGDATQQHQEDLIYFEKGWNHFEPRYGVGITRYLNDTEGLVGLTATIRAEMERDGQIVEEVAIQKGAIQIQAIYA